MSAQRVALVRRLAEQLPRPEVGQLRNVHRPVDVGGGKDRAEQVVHRDVAVEVDDQLVDVVTRRDVGPLSFEEMRPAGRVATLVVRAGHNGAPASRSTRRSTAGNNRLFSLWTWR